jgi:hypothetical protein
MNKIYRIGPDTTTWVGDIDFRHFSGYNFYDTMVRGFSHTRLAGAGVTDLGNFGIMPSRNYNLDYLSSNESSWWSTMDKSTEVAHPGYYAVMLNDTNIYAENVAVSEHVGMHKYHWDDSMYDTNSNNSKGLIIDICHAAGMKPTDSPQCKDASLHVSSDKSSFSGSVLFAGSLSHSLMVYVYGEIILSESSGYVASWTTCESVESNIVCAEVYDLQTTGGKLHSYIDLINPGDVEVIMLMCLLGIVSQVIVSFRYELALASSMKIKRRLTYRTLFSACLPRQD